MPKNKPAFFSTSKIQTRMAKAGLMGGSPSPGLVVIGDDSCSRGCGFESRHHIQDGLDIFSHVFVVKMYCLFEKAEN